MGEGRKTMEDGRKKEEILGENVVDPFDKLRTSFWGALQNYQMNASLFWLPGTARLFSPFSIFFSFTVSTGFSM